MFGKIREKLKKVFEKSEKILENEEEFKEIDKKDFGLKEDRGEEISKKNESILEEDGKDLEEKVEEKSLEILENEEEFKEIDKKDFGLKEDEGEEISKKNESILEEDGKDLEEKVEEKSLEILENEEEFKEIDKKDFGLKEDEGEEISKKNESILEEDGKDLEEKVEEKSLEILEEENLEEVPKKKSFFSKFFGKKEEEKIPEKLEEEVLVEDKVLEEDLTEDLKVEENLDLANLKQDGINLEKDKLVEEEKVEVQKKENIFSSAFSKLKKRKISQDEFSKIWIEIEILLLEINVAYEIVEKIEEKLKSSLLEKSFDRFSLKNSIKKVLIEEVEIALKNSQGNFLEDILKVKKNDSPIKILILGVNGSGKTTTIGKVINYLKEKNLSCVVSASDTFRAAAVEQVEQHCKNLNVKCVSQKKGADPASVAYDAIEHAKAKNIDVVLIDTAGRMPNDFNLLCELQKIQKVSASQMAIFVGDSICGNDLIEQIKLFNEGVEISGVILTKVDIDEKPGSVVTTAYSIDKPIYFLGKGQNYDDLVEFNSVEIAEKLFSED